MPRNTTGLEKFNNARDAVLAENGVPTQAAFTAAVRKEYTANDLKGFEGWNKARDLFLNKLGFANGYKSLMDAAKERNKTMQ